MNHPPPSPSPPPPTPPPPPQSSSSSSTSDANRSRRRRRRPPPASPSSLQSTQSTSNNNNTRRATINNNETIHPHPPKIQKSRRERERERLRDRRTSTTTTTITSTTTINRTLPPQPKFVAQQRQREKEEEKERQKEKEKQKEKERQLKEQKEKELKEQREKEQQRILQQQLEQSSRRLEERNKNLPFNNNNNNSTNSSNTATTTTTTSTTTIITESIPSVDDTNLLLSSSSSSSSSFIHQQQRPSDSELRKLDSSLKKCTGFLKKIRTTCINEDSIQSLSTESHSLNLSRYISEVVSAMAESKLRSADVPYFITLAGQLHRRYEDFIAQLLSSLTTIVITNSNSNSNNNSNNNGRELPARKAAMRLLVEFYIVAMFSDVMQIINVLKHLMKPIRDSKDEQLNHLSIISSFVRCASRCLLPKSKSTNDNSSYNKNNDEKAESEQHDQTKSNSSSSSSTVWEDQTCTESSKITIYTALQSYFESEVNRIIKESIRDLQKAGEAVTRAKQVRDAPDDVTAAAFDSAKQYCEKSVTAANVIAEALNKPLYPSVAEIPILGEGNGNIDANQIFVANSFSYVSKNKNIAQGQDLDIMQNADHPFESDEQRMFYTELVEVESLLSNNKNNSNSTTEKQSINTNEKKNDASYNSNSSSKKRASEKSIAIERIVNKLSNVDSKDSADLFVQFFITSKEAARGGPIIKRLSRALFTVSPQKLNILPSHARVAANLQPLYNGEVGLSVASSLEDDFRTFVAKADVDGRTLSICVKCSQYIGEYVKFGIISISTMFDLLSLCMKDLSGHRIDIVCNLLESCGRFVYRTFSSHIRMSNILDTLWRVKSVRNLESKHNSLIESTFYTVKLSTSNSNHGPGNHMNNIDHDHELMPNKFKSRTPIQQYIRHLIYYRLDATNITWTRNQFLKLPWNEEMEFYVIKKFVKISRVRYSTIPHIASLISALQKHKPNVVIGIIDLLLECVRLGIERNDGRDSQRRLAEVFLLGEMYKCNVVNEKLIYNVLYQIITLGHEDLSNNSNDLSPNMKKANSDCMIDENQVQQQSVSSSRSSSTNFNNVPDPPGDFFRIRLICVMTESCGRNLVKSNRRTFEIFLAYLERYLFCKTYQAGLGDRIPLHIEHMLDDVLEGIVSNSRVVKDLRVSSHSNNRGYRNDKANISRSIIEAPWQMALTKPFERTKSLEEAVTAVNRIEQSTVDSALIYMPIRRIIDPEDLRKDVVAAKASELNRNSESNGTGSRDANARRGNNRSLKESSITQESKDTGKVMDNDMSAVIDAGSSAEDEDEDEEVTIVYPEEEDISGDEDDMIDSTLDESEHADDYTFDNGENGHDDQADENIGLDEDDADDEGEDDDEDDEGGVLVENVARMKEEDAFAKELAAFTAEEVQNARASNTRVARLDRMVIPMGLMSKRMEEERAAIANQALQGDSDDRDSFEEQVETVTGSADHADKADIEPSQQAGEARKKVEFKVLMRIGGKSQLAGLRVPASSSIAVAARESENADLANNEETKRLVLGSSTMQNHEEHDQFDDDVPMQVESNARAREESIRQQRATDEQELLNSFYRHRPVRRR